MTKAVSAMRDYVNELCKSAYKILPKPTKGLTGGSSVEFICLHLDMGHLSGAV